MLRICMISSQFRYTYSNMEMILNGCGSHMVFLPNVLHCWMKKNCAPVIHDTLRSLFTNEAL